jgi:hypothetical protein
MPTKICKVSRMSSKPLSMDVYLDYLKERLADENKGFIRAYIRRKVKKLSGATNTETPPLRKRYKTPS